MSAPEFNLGAAMAGGNASPSRPKPDNEFYPTPIEAIDALMQPEGGSIRRYWRVWDPCAGNGRIGHALEHYRVEVAGTDLVDRGYGQGSLDFLQWSGECPSKAIVTNPPFSLAPQFALQARALGMDYVAFLVPSTFWHADERGKLWELWQPARIYALTFRLDFLDLGNPTMNCIWVIWDRRHTGETVYRRMSRAPARGQGNLLGAMK